MASSPRLHPYRRTLAALSGVRSGVTGWTPTLRRHLSRTATGPEARVLALYALEVDYDYAYWTLDEAARTGRPKDETSTTADPTGTNLGNASAGRSTVNPPRVGVPHPPISHRRASRSISASITDRLQSELWRLAVDDIESPVFSVDGPRPTAGRPPSLILSKPRLAALRTAGPPLRRRSCDGRAADRR